MIGDFLKYAELLNFFKFTGKQKKKIINKCFLYKKLIKNFYKSVDKCFWVDYNIYINQKRSRI